MANPGLVKFGNATFEGFDERQLVRARRAWENAKKAASKALQSIKSFDKTSESGRILRWFGLSPQSNPAHAQLLMGVQGKVAAINEAFALRPITIAYRPTIQVKHVPADAAAALVPGFTGESVYGYVWQHKAGSGFRVIMGKWFLADPAPNEDAQTIYHELSHKVAKTKDHCYGTQKCVALAQSDPKKACDNADNLGYFAKSLI